MTKAATVARLLRACAAITLGALTVVLAAVLVWPQPSSASHSNTDAPATLTMHEIPVLFPVPSVASARSGNWSDPATWAPAGVPGAGADVHVLSGHIVTYDISATAALRSLSVFGTLGFSRTVDTKLNVGYTLVHPGGYLQIGTPADPIPVGRRAEIVIADQPIDLTRDPLQWGTGINVLGRVDVAGAPLSKTFVRLTREPMAGDTTLTLAEAVTGWQPGDRLILPDTRRVDYDMRTGQWGNPPFSYFIDDVKISSVSGATVTLQSALKYDHFASYLGKRGAGGVPEFYPHVVNLTRNIVVRSANPSGTRGQVSFLDRARVDVRYAEFIDLGRTRGDVPLGSPDPTRPGYSNQVGRYPVHLHHLKGPLTSDPDKPQYQGANYQAIILGNSTHHEVANPPKGWYTIHQTHYSLIQDNVGYNAHGVGYYFEDGSERENLVKRNIGIRVNGHAGRVDSDQNNPATDGTIFYFKGPMNRVTDNVAANSNAYGMIFFFKYAGKWFAPPAPGAEYTQQYDLNATPLTEVRGNEAYGAMVNGMAVWWLNLFGSPSYSQPTASMSVVKDFTVWHVQDYGVFNYEVQGLTWDHLVIRGDETRPGNVGMYFADYYQINSRILNPDIQGVTTGILKPFITSFAGEVGVTTIEGTGGGCFFKNKVNVATYTPWHNSGGAGAKTPSQLVVRNCKFAYSSVGPASEQYHLYRAVVARDVSNYVALDSMVVYDFNQVAGDNFAVYYEEQNPAAIMPASSGNIVGSPEAGLTNQQAWNKYGVALAGAVAPCTTLRAGIEGYACALSGATPPPAVAPTVAITSPVSGATITGTSVTANFSTSGDRTQADHLHLQLDALPEVRGIAFDGSYTFTNVSAGSHTLRVYLAKADHMALTNAGASASVTFTTVSATVPPTSTGQLGNATVAGSVDNGDSNYISAVRFTMPNVAGTATAMSVYIGSPVGTAPNNQFSLAIYADAQGAPGARVANTANGTITPVAWNTLPITAALAPNATYWLAYNTNGTAPNQNNFYIAPGLTNQLTWIAQPFGSWPATAGRPLGSSNHTASIYVAYTSGTTPPPACTPNWQCTNWSACTLGTQTHTCTDLNRCGTTAGKPAESQSCTATPVPTLTITSPAPGAAVTATSVDVRYQYSGLSYIPHLRVVVDAQAPVTLEPPQVTLTYAVANLAAGSHTVRLTLLDNGHQPLPNPEASASVSFTVQAACTPNWNCTAWTACSTGTQTRTCTDLNSCGTTTGRPPLSQSCTGTAPPPPSTTFAINDRVRTTENLNVRSTAEFAGALLGIQAQGSLGTVIGGPTFVDASWWWRINYDNAPDGWSIENYLARARILKNGDLLKLTTDSRVYLIENGLRRWIVDAYTFTALGYTDSQIITVTQAEFNQFPAGPDLKLTCTPNWTCTAYSSCTLGTQTRTCTDFNSCGTTTNKPAETQSCTVTSPSSGTAPSVSSVSGTVSHGSSITVTGASFGAKLNATPYIWDDASGPQTAVRSATPAYGPWDFAYPYTNDPAFRLAYRKPSEVIKANGVVGGVPLPHNHISRYLAGAHYNSGPTDTHAGYNVTAGKNNQQGQQYTYISYYVRVDPSWQFDSGDHNFKEYDYAAGNGYMGDGPNSYFALYDINQSNASWAANYIEGMNVAIRSVNTSLVNWYPQFDTVFSTTSSPSPVQAWRKVEYILKHNDSADGVHSIIQDNIPEWEVHLDDDGVASPVARAETVFGGYAREAGSTEAYKNNWRYYADVYYDHSWARVMLANHADYARATIVEPQPPASWADGAISAKVNLGKLPDTGTAYLFVFNANGTRNATGFPVTLGGTTPPPACTPNWQCDAAWSACVNSTQTRTCTDANACGTFVDKPLERQSCDATPPVAGGAGGVAFRPHLEGRSSVTGLTFTLRFLDPATLAELAQFSAAPAATIALPPTVRLEPRPYVVVVSAPGYLRRKAALTVAANTTFDLPELSAGDFNGDNLVNTLDWSGMNARWFFADAAADFNGDGVVNSLDFSALNRNWNRQGE